MKGELLVVTKEHLYATSFQHDEEIYSVVQ